jgi:putative intracellular protease/amidase
MYLRPLALLFAAIGVHAPAQSAHVHEGAETTVAILMFDGVQIIDFAAPYEVFGQAMFNVYTVSADGGPVTTAMGLNVNVDHAFDDAPAADIILVPGGDTRAVRLHAPTLAWLRDHSGRAKQVLSVCTGSFILADAGLLDGGNATTFHRAFDRFEAEYPGITLLRDQRWVDNGKVVTSAGLASGIDAALHVVAERLGVRKAQSIALHLEYAWSPEQGFIRGLMADRHIRLPEPELPAGTVIDTVLQVGDQERWEIEYRVRSSWSPAELVAHVAARAEDEPGLTLLETESPLAAAWHYESEYGGRWMLRVWAEEPENDGDAFQAQVSVERYAEKLTKVRPQRP